MSIIAGVILAGGLSRRMGGGDKCLLPLGDSTLLDIAIQRTSGQVDILLLSVNGDASRFDDRGLPVAVDEVEGHAGPLAGILTAMHWCDAHCPEAEWVLSVASDTPFFPLDLTAQYKAGAGRRIIPSKGMWRLNVFRKGLKCPPCAAVVQ